MKSIKNLKTMLKLVDHIDYKQDWDTNTFTIYTMQGYADRRHHLRKLNGKQMGKFQVRVVRT